MSTIYTRWRARLAVRRRLLAVARRRYIWHPTSANRATLALRRQQVDHAQRVVQRHRPLARPTGVSERCVDFIAAFEGGQSPDGLFRPYRDAVGVWTIGYGHTHGVSAASRPLTKAQALALLRDDLDRTYAPPVLALAHTFGLTQGEVDALVSLVYNCGPGAIAVGTTIGNAIRRRDRQAAADGFLLWDRAGGQVLPGLLRRRQAERALFLGA